MCKSISDALQNITKNCLQVCNFELGSDLWLKSLDQWQPVQSQGGGYFNAINKGNQRTS